MIPLLRTRMSDDAFQPYRVPTAVVGRRIVWWRAGRVQRKKDADTSPFQTPPPRGSAEQNLADAPLRGRGNKFCLC